MIAPLYFDGITYDPVLDKHRLGKQLQAVYGLMRDGYWRTLEEIAHAVGIPEASASARLRDLRKDRFGAYTIERQRRGDGVRGLFEYRMVVEKLVRIPPKLAKSAER